MQINIINIQKRKIVKTYAQQQMVTGFLIYILLIYKIILLILVVCQNKSLNSEILHKKLLIQNNFPLIFLTLTMIIQMLYFFICITFQLTKNQPASWKIWSTMQHQKVGNIVKSVIQLNLILCYQLTATKKWDILPVAYVQKKDTLSQWFGFFAFCLLQFFVCHYL